ncbi:hypothetical protein CCHL11_06970 [Colletotrichum chlorophyti]|uniref:Uncharacterized protein n=1 Tax=Colletotrichum chlorophyti TaxID=708187 RepID=A0A1Q8RBI8_9PEZI|nr:hypothetical protein CCHL11_06970 [Colletotrichum chlorophyti]
MRGHVLRGQFNQRCAESLGTDYSTAWPLQARVPVLIVITLFFMWMHPAIVNIFKCIIWATVKPIALTIGWLSVAFVRTLLFVFIDGPALVSSVLNGNTDLSLDLLNSLDVDNKTKVNTIWTSLHVEEEHVPCGVFDKKYKPFLATQNMKLSGPRQKRAMMRDRGLSC